MYNFLNFYIKKKKWKLGHPKGGSYILQQPLTLHMGAICLWSWTARVILLNSRAGNQQQQKYFKSILMLLLILTNARKIFFDDFYGIIYGIVRYS